MQQYQHIGLTRLSKAVRVILTVQFDRLPETGIIHTIPLREEIRNYLVTLGKPKAFVTHSTGNAFVTKSLVPSPDINPSEFSSFDELHKVVLPKRVSMRSGKPAGLTFSKTPSLRQLKN